MYDSFVVEDMLVVDPERVDAVRLDDEDFSDTGS